MKEYYSYTIKLQYLGGFEEDFSDRDKWNRVFKVNDSVTLEMLGNIIQKILGWDGNHLYIFKIKDNQYAFMGSDFPIILDSVNIKYVSCDIKLKDLKFNIDEEFLYNYDFGDEHRFSLIIQKQTIAANKNCQLLSYYGNDIEQYPDTCSNLFIEYKNNSPSQNLFRKIDFVDSMSEYKRIIRFIYEDDYEVLKKWRKSKDKKKWGKAVVILENLKTDIQTLSEKIECPVREIQKWINDFNAYGIKGIDTKRKKRDDKKRRARAENKAKRILEIFHQKPIEFGINRSNWTLGSLVKVYEKEYCEKTSGSSVARYLKESAYRITKARSVLTSSDPDYREKVDSLLKILWSLKDDEELFFIDELGPLQVKKYGGKCYTAKGEILSAPQNQKSKGSITLSAALSAKCNQITWIYGKSKDSFAMMELIEVLFNQHQDKSKLFITWDAASWHSSNELIEWLNDFNCITKGDCEGPTIEFVPLPSCSQFLNVIESVFSGMKRAVIHHSDYQSEEEMKMMISNHFRERNSYFRTNPKRAGKKIWEIDFFKDYNNIKSGDYREW